MANGGIIGPTYTPTVQSELLTSFTSGGTFNAQPQTTTVDVLLVAGGGGAGQFAGGGGGAGGVIFRPALPISAPTSYPISIGGGGSGATSNYQQGNTGSDTTGFSLTAKGGGGGGARAERRRRGSAATATAAAAAHARLARLLDFIQLLLRRLHRLLEGLSRREVRTRL